jgi:hypothetical protein
MALLCALSPMAPMFLLEGVERLVMMFDGHDQSSSMRPAAQWKTLKAGGHALTYWQQTPPTAAGKRSA